MALRKVYTQPGEIEFEYVSVRQASFMLGLTEQTVFKLVRSGELTQYKLAFSNVTLISRKELEDYDNKRERDGAKDSVGV